MKSDPQHDHLPNRLPKEFVAAASTAARTVFGPRSKLNPRFQAIDFDGRFVPLVQLYRNLSSTDPDNWMEAICSRLEQMLEVTERLAEDTSDWHHARPRLHVCVRKSGTVNGISKPISPNLCYTLVINTEDYCVRVTSADLRSWPVGNNTAWQTGLDNNTRNIDVQRTLLRHGGADLEIFSGDLNASGIVTNIGNYFDPRLPMPSLLALPTHETVVLIRPKRSVAGMQGQQLRALLSMWSTQSEHPLTSELFTLNNQGDLTMSCPNSALPADATRKRLGFEIQI